MTAGTTARIRWGDVLLSAVAAVSWAFLAMAGVAALGLHLLGADSAASLGPLTAAAVALAVGGSVTPSGDVSAFGLEGQAAESAVDIAPLGVGLVGALVLGWVFARSLRRVGATVGWGELAARAGVLAGLFVALLAFLAWAGHDSVTIDGKTLAGLGGLVGGGGGGSGGGGGDGGLLDRLRDGLGGLGIGDGDNGGLPERIADLIGAKASVGFAVDTGASLAGGLVWVLGVLMITVLAARRAPLPRALTAAHRFVRPAASALVTVALVAVAAGLAAAGYAAIGDDHPRRVLGAALLAAPNGVWLGIPLGLFVPWHGSASGVLTRFLPDPVDRLLDGGNGARLTIGRLAELDGRVWLLPVAAVLMMLLAGVFTAVRTPREGARTLPFALRCAAGLGALTALTLPLMVHLTGVSANASLSVFGFDAFGAGLELRGSVPAAFALGAVWGAVAGLVGGLLACATGAAGRRAVRLPERAGPEPEDVRGYGQDADARTQRHGHRHAAPTPGYGAPGYPDAAHEPGPYTPSPVYRPPNADTNPYMRPPESREREPYPRRPESGRTPPSPPPGQPPRRQSWPTPPAGPPPETQTWPPPPEQPPRTRDWGPPPAGHAAPTARRPGNRPPENPPPPESHPTVGSGYQPPPPPRPPVPPKPRGAPRKRREDPPDGPPPPGRPGGGR
ncbi:streptophobe family protein [Streptomyces rimosus]|uniref:streptophobe family protein n=1 Tax=Streptomyces rimosus TaxID=1927 RepID=UPI0031D7E15A